MMTEAEKQQQETDFIRSMVLRKFPLLGVTMSSLKTVADDTIGTAATDGKTVYYSPKFFSNLSDDEKTFLYAHEVMHVAFNHILRSKDRDARLWNTATDSVINQILKSEGLPMVDGGVDMADAINHSAEEMYEKLLNEKQQKQSNPQQSQSGQCQCNKQQQSQSGQSQDKQQQGQSGQSQEQQKQQPQQNNSAKSPQNQDNEQQQENNNSTQGNGDGEESEQAGHDNHDIWKKAVEDAEKEQQRQQQEASQKSLLDKIKEMLGNKKAQQKPEQKQSPSQADENGQRAKGSESAYERNFLAENAEERRQQAEQIRRKLEHRKNETIKAQAERSSSSLGPVGKAKAVTNWKKLLKKSITEDEDRWSYRRSDADNDYMARVEELEDENKSETEVMLDVSGSVNEEMLKEFLRQLKPILKTSKLKVGCFDHRLYDFREIKNDRDIDNFPISGGGGTNIDLAVRAFSQKKEINKIVFTDGYSNDMPKNDLKNMNVIWLIYDNDNFHPVCGKVIYIDKRQIANARFASAHALPTRGGR